MATREALAVQLRRFRTLRGLSAAQLGRRAGLSSRTVLQLEAEALDRNPNLDTLDRIAAVLEVPVWVLFGGEHPVDPARLADFLRAHELAGTLANRIVAAMVLALGDGRIAVPPSRVMLGEVQDAIESLITVIGRIQNGVRLVP